mgnify:CR=1 FL=1
MNRQRSTVQHYSWQVFFENFAQNRVQIIGKAEHLFIEEVEKDVENAKNIYKRFIGAGIPVIVFCRNLHPSEMMIKVAKEYGVPVLISQDTTSEFMAEVIRWLGTVLAPSITIHGVLAMYLVKDPDHRREWNR